MATKVEGIERLKKRWARIPAHMKAQVAIALDKSVGELVEFQKRLVPVDQGDLRDSIKSRMGRHELAREVVAGNERAFYAAMVEFGTVNTPAQPFFFPPYRSLRKRIKARVRAAVRKAVRSNV